MRDKRFNNVQMLKDNRHTRSMIEFGKTLQECVIVSELANQSRELMENMGYQEDVINKHDFRFN